MSNTNLHKDKGKFNNGLLEEIPRNLQNYFDRSNWDIDEFRALKKNKTEKILDKEMKEEIRIVLKSENIDFDIPEQEEILKQIMGREQIMEKYKTIHESRNDLEQFYKIGFDLDLSVRALNSIKQTNIKTTDELLNLTDLEMKALGFGNKTICEINDIKNNATLFPKVETRTSIIAEFKNKILQLDKYDNYNGEDNACFITTTVDGEYVKIEDVLNLFQPRKIK